MVNGKNMKASVSPDLCISCELCANLCPEVFSMGDDGFAHGIDGDIPSDKVSDAENARDSCPTSAIDID